MYDTLRFWFNIGLIPDGYPLGIKPHLYNPQKEYIKKQNNQKKDYSYSHFLDNDDSKYYCWVGYIGIIRVSIYKNGISVQVSLPKYYHGTNFEKMTLETTKIAIIMLINELKEKLHLDLRKATVTRIDYAIDMNMKHQPSEYYECLGKKPPFSHENTLYHIISKLRRFAFYDKTIEAEAKGNEIPEQKKGQNNFRGEFRLMGSISKQLKWKKELNCDTLYDEEFYNLVVQRCYDEFMKIPKNKDMNTIPEGTKTVNDAKDVFVARHLPKLEQSDITDFLNQCRAEKIFSHRHYYTNLKNKLNELITTPTSKRNEMIQELETKFYEVIKRETER